MESEPPGPEHPFQSQGRSDALTAAMAVIAAVVIWIPTMAAVPRYSDTESGSPWLYPLLAVAAVALAAFRPRSWVVVAPALVLPLLLLAPFSAPRGDTTGLWGLIFPILCVWGVLLFGIAWVASRPAVTRWARVAAAVLVGAFGVVLVALVASAASSTKTTDDSAKASWCSYAKYLGGTRMVEMAATHADYAQVWWVVSRYGTSAPRPVQENLRVFVAGIGEMRGQTVPRVASPATLEAAARVDSYVASACPAT